MIYLDYQATTPVAPEAAAAMQPWIEEKFANPHSPSRWGAEAAAAIEVARGQVERAIGLSGGSVAFTGSATEALNWALKGSAERSDGTRHRIVTIATEHAAVLDTCGWLEGHGFEIVRLPVGKDGLVSLTDVAAAVDGRTLLVAAMLVNNEIGVIQPIAEIARLAHDHGALCSATPCRRSVGCRYRTALTSSPCRRTKSMDPRQSGRCGCARARSRRR
jgi:cysteine desulfurase